MSDPTRRHPLLFAAVVLCLVAVVALVEAFPIGADLEKLRSEIDWSAVQGAFREGMQAFNEAAP